MLAAITTHALATPLRTMASTTTTTSCATTSNSSCSCDPTDSFCSSWEHVPKAAPDLILGVAAAFNQSKAEGKVNLSVGAYRDGAGKPVVLQCVKEAERRLVARNPGHEYLPISGLPEFIRGAKQLAFGTDGKYISHANVATVQALSGTGSLRVAAEFLRKFHTSPAGNVTVMLPKPTWPNHNKIFTAAGFTDIRSYTYYDPSTKGVDSKGMVRDIQAAPEGSIILFHACAHNPTGADPAPSDWKMLHEACRAKKHVVLFDCAYQGFASGDPERDILALREFISRGVPPLVLLCQSFAKNMGLYGERVGATSVVCQFPNEAERVTSQLEQVIRPMYSSPPAWGARLAAEVLNDAELFALWKREVAEMAGRIIDSRDLLVDALRKEEEEGTGSANEQKKDWSFIQKQIGMFSYTGLSKAQCDRLTKEFHIFLPADGRISMAGLNKSNIIKVARALNQVTSDQ